MNSPRGAFSSDATEQKMARHSWSTRFRKSALPTDVFADPRERSAAIRPSRRARKTCSGSSNFLYVLAADGRAEKSALGDHSARRLPAAGALLSVSAEARLNFARNIGRVHRLPRRAHGVGLEGTLRCGQPAARRVYHTRGLRRRYLPLIAETATARVTSGSPAGLYRQTGDVFRSPSFLL